jgi:branched-chain amino acid transport system substrate-binding protein
MTAVVATALALAVSGCGSDNSSSAGSGGSNGGSSKTISIGSLHPLSGALAGAGKPMDQAVQMAVDDINGAGGITSMGGAKLKVESADTQGKAEAGQSEASRLISAGVAALVGTYQSDVTTNVASVAERSQVPLVIDVAVADQILQQGYKYTFRIQPDATSMGTKGADDLADIGKQQSSPVTKVAYIHVQGDFGDSVFKAFQKEAQSKGIQVVKEVSYAATISDATTQVSEAAAAKPDAIVATGYFPDSLLIAKSVAAAQPPVKAVYGIANGGFDDERFPASAGVAGNKILSANYHFDASSDAVKDVRQRFQTKYGQPMQTAAVLSYQAVKVIAKALEDGKSSEPKKLRDAISKVSIDKPLLAFNGPITFDDKGQNKNAGPIVMQVQGGKVEQVFPKEFKTVDLVWPAVPGA